ncbi:MAG: hypothetical protein MSH60_15665, partial [Ruminococcus sp.]|nr:hypothetical protein [Ruminococcus sp.]
VLFVLICLCFFCYIFLSAAFGDFASAEATGALPLDPAAFRKGWRNFYIFVFHFSFLTFTFSFYAFRF